ncbi:ArsR family transcriptional regulator [Chryseoglobus sp. 28M-23]|uniref:ArsR family transcriptional regulator n=1 Tax=Chryseoglobus sp. 28M-23 TaxID=2772253 RepID=UPI00174717D0|nr:ArsR family transcriptional regulator [Chryseoglobus sp. 28M-23]QOD92795.1 ArsR family transcriptional regulator [Chryseoglobus sp. 28M-23]
MKVEAPAIFPLLRSDAQGQILATLELSHRGETAADLARQVEASLPTVTRELARLHDAGIIEATPVGRRAVYRLNVRHPLAEAVREIAMFAHGPQPVVARELSSVPGIVQAVLFGSWAARRRGEPGPPPGDIDLLVVGRPDRDELYDALRRAEGRLRREVNATTITPERWATVDDPFVATVRARPWVDLDVDTGVSA